MDLENLSVKIKSELEIIGKPFSEFHYNSGMHCPSDCGKCCFNPEIACHPYELLPLAMDLLKRGVAEEVLESAKNNLGKNCVLLKVIDEKFGLAKCSEYQFRPSICRAFGVSGRMNKNEKIELSICKHLKQIYPENNFDFASENIPYISLVKRKLEAIDPVLIGPQININEALIIILEKVLLWNQYKS